MVLDIRHLLKEGQKKLNENHEQEAKLKANNMRCGSGGILVGSEVYGGCMRMHYLRMKGIEVPTPDYLQVMFSAGLANEDSVAKVIEAAGVKIKREDEIPVVAEYNGVTLSGRPDIVIVDDEGKPQVGLELKHISSVYTARDVLAGASAKGDHLIQAATYSKMFGGLSYKIVYTNSINLHLLYNKYLVEAFKQSPNLTEPNEKGDPMYVKPGRFVFDLEWRGETLWYGIEGQDKYETKITYSAIDNYYNALSTLTPESRCPEMLAKGEVEVGRAPKDYTMCKYCELLPVCKTQPKTMQEFTDKAVLLIKEM